VVLENALLSHHYGGSDQFTEAAFTTDYDVHSLGQRVVAKINSNSILDQHIQGGVPHFRIHFYKSL
jgi:hypothetical protein